LLAFATPERLPDALAGHEATAHAGPDTSAHTGTDVLPDDPLRPAVHLAVEALAALQAVF
jgi:hypothetical protein